ncbi:hypothetical protein D9O40_14275 [Clostridium autoethanogenum]|uniref:Uncharacterized protein n=1 Tax=Clostridium autoethanogenum TaxID=84023 RepID=A0A3M0SHB9_9CLOT|nr:hypothetical protein [Clostridium autoethanogenum]RMC97793.1 hypothetical protein D9O40_14275 [Clostridium autoethanogenum]
MFEIENFKKVNLTTGLPYMSITRNGITFSKNVIIKMGRPAYVELLMNDADKQIAIKVCDENEEDAIQFVKSKKTINVRWNNKDFLNTLSKMMGWSLDKGGYRVLGDWYDNEKAMLFELSKAKATLIGEKENESDD